MAALITTYTSVVVVCGIHPVPFQGRADLGLVFSLPPVGEWSIVMSMSVCVSVHEFISGTASPNCTKFSKRVACDCGSVLFRWHFNTLCTYSFLDDVMFSHDWPHGTGNASGCKLKCLTRGQHIVDTVTHQGQHWTWYLQLLCLCFILCCGVFNFTSACLVLLGFIFSVQTETVPNFLGKDPQSKHSQSVQLDVKP